MMGWNGFGMGWWMWPLMVLTVVGFWAVVIALVRGLTRDPAPPAPESPLALLDRRLVLGEIDSDEYERLRRIITNGH